MKNSLQTRQVKGRLFPFFLYACLFFLFSAQAYSSGQEPLSLSLSSTSLSQGDAALISVCPLDSVVSATVVWQKQRISLVRFAEKDMLGGFLAIPRNEKPGRKKIEVIIKTQDGRRSRHALSFTVRKKDFPVQRLTLPESKVTLSQKDLSRHKREKTVVSEVFSHPSQGRLWKSPFTKPIPGEISTPFGVRRILNDKPRNSHSGIDLRAAMGQPVAASSEGVVVLTADHFFAGKSIYLDHGMGVISMYFHLSEIRVKKGEQVGSGEIIGFAGSSGRSTAPHLHWGIRVNNINVDPFSLVSLTNKP